MVVMPNFGAAPNVAGEVASRIIYRVNGCATSSSGGGGGDTRQQRHKYFVPMFVLPSQAQTESSQLNLQDLLLRETSERGLSQKVLYSTRKKILYTEMTLSTETRITRTTLKLFNCLVKLLASEPDSFSAFEII